MAKTHYETLGVAPTATEEAIKHAYRKITRADHPDRNASPDAHERFRRASEAYEVLGDPERRAQYDQQLRVVEPDAELLKATGDLGRTVGRIFDQKVPAAGGIGQAAGAKLGEALGTALSDLLRKREGGENGR